ncbi:MAG: Permease YjgP/YjgQ [uncultured Campylobacterales bacterium]|uniref:Permease YjgP/YjgQ n=1 Tax=uncultured Campylobacterales bacterium TaxID=352960 RepID=A0A6S6S7E8_9BACT|nr:MAG: Permease YjgP/YjgQ [uncultured Campylobacterales bacterium]
MISILSLQNIREKTFVMKLFNRYILLRYIKFLVIVFFALELFYVGLDLLSNYKDLPNSANLQILYIFYKFIEASGLTLPISLIFAMVFTKLSLIRSSELVAMFALGISRNKAIKPIFLFSILMIFAHLSIGFTNLVYSGQYAKNILKYSKATTNTKDIFIKHFDSYIYIQKLSIYDKKAYNVIIYELQDSDLSKIVKANSAVFKDSYWLLEDVEVMYKKSKMSINKKAIIIKNLPTFKTLHNFDPKIIDNIFSNSDTTSIVEAVKIIKIFSEQNFDNSRLKTILYSSVIFPFFACFLLLIFFYYIPISGRFFNTSLLSFLLISVSLVVWAILFILIEMASNSVVNPEIAIVLPILFLGLYAFKLYSINKRSAKL